MHGILLKVYLLVAEVGVLLDTNRLGAWLCRLLVEIAPERGEYLQKAKSSGECS